MVLTSNFAPLWDAAAWWLLLASAIVSLFASTRAHWLGPLLAAPAMVFIWLLDRSIAAGYGMGPPTVGQWLAFFAPAVVGLLSIGMWAWKFRRRARRNRADE
jgi:hypothetical protein